MRYLEENRLFGTLDPSELRVLQESFEERVFLGDASFYRAMTALADARAPLVTLEQTEGEAPRDATSLKFSSAWSQRLRSRSRWPRS